MAPGASPDPGHGRWAAPAAATIRPVSHPWTSPEFVSLGRLQMHALAHHDRLELDGEWRFQLTRTPIDAPTDDGWRRGARSGLLDAPGDLGPAAVHQRPDALPGPAAGATGAQSDRPSTGRTFELPASWSVAAGRPPRRGGRERPARPARRCRRRREQGFAPGGRVRRDRPRPAGHERPRAPRRQVVRRDVHRGPGPVVARRHHPLGLPVLDRAGPPGRRRRHRGAGGRPADGDAPRGRGSGVRRRRARARLDGRDRRPGPPRAAACDRAAGRRPRPPAGRRFAGPHATPRGRRAGRDGPDAAAWARLRDRLVPPLGGRVAFDAEVGPVEPWSAESPTRYPLDVALAAPDGTVVERGHDPDRLPAGRDPRRRPADQRTARVSSAASTATTSTSTPAG